MKKLFLLLTGVFILVAIPVTVLFINQNQDARSKAAPATTLAFSPSRITRKVGDTFQLEVVIDTGENQVVAAELHLTYDPEKLEAQTITNGSLFPNILSSGVIESGTADITVGAASAAQPVSGTGTVAVVKFKALATTDTPVSVRFATNTFAGSPGEGATNALVGTTPASITINNGEGDQEGFQANDSTLTPTPTQIQNQESSDSADLTGTPTPTPTGTTNTLTPTPTDSQSSSSSSTLTITSPVGLEVSTTQPTISGKAPPGSTITITIYSEPQTAVITADQNGNWSYTPTVPLEDGEHDVVVSLTNTEGETQTASGTFIVASGAEVAQGQSAEVPVTGILDHTLLIVGIGLVLLIIGAAVPVFIR